MRPLVSAALFTSILLCAPFSTPQSRGLYSFRRSHLMIDLLRLGAQPCVQESISLEPGKPVERELSGGQSHSYKITMASGQYLQVVVEQRGIDVAVALFTPGGKEIDEADSEKSFEGAETISVIAEAPGAYRIDVRSAEKSA